MRGTLKCGISVSASAESIKSVRRCACVETFPAIVNFCDLFLSRATAACHPFLFIFCLWPMRHCQSDASISISPFLIIQFIIFCKFFLPPYADAPVYSVLCTIATFLSFSCVHRCGFTFSHCTPDKLWYFLDGYLFVGSALAVMYVAAVDAVCCAVDFVVVVVVVFFSMSIETASPLITYYLMWLLLELVARCSSLVAAIVAPLYCICT